MDAFNSPQAMPPAPLPSRPSSSHLRQPPSNPTQQRPQAPQQQKLRSACDACGEAKLRCPREHPACQRCINHGIPCVYSASRRAGRRRKNKSSISSTGNENADGSGTVSGSSNNGSTTNLAKVGNVNSSKKSTSPESPQQRYQANSTDTLMTGLSDNELAVPREQQHNDVLRNPHQHDMPAPDGSISDPANSLKWLPDQWLPTPNSIDHMFSSLLDQPRSDENDGLLLQDMNNHMTPDMSSHTMPPYDNTYSLDPFNTELTGDGSADIMKTFIDPANVMDTGVDPPSGHPDSAYFSSAGSDATMNVNSSYSPSNSSTSSASVCQSGCFEQVTRHLSSLSSRTQSQVLVDSIVTIEKETDAVKQKVTSCPACMDNSRIFLLLSMIVEQTIALFESLSDCQFLANNANDSDMSHTQNIEVALEKCFGGTYSPSQGIDASKKLYLGNIEVTGDTKSMFVKQMIRRRLRRIADMLLDLQKVVTTSRTKNCNKDAAEAIMKDSSHRIELLQGMLEFWK